jgi:hypothetical protein
MSFIFAMFGVSKMASIVALTAAKTIVIMVKQAARKYVSKTNPNLGKTTHTYLGHPMHIL